MPMPTRPVLPRQSCDFGVKFIALVLLMAASAAWGSELRRTTTVRILEEVSGAVVNIHGQKTLSPMDEGYRRETPQNVNGMGTGVVIDSRGFILTNHHVVDGVREIAVTLADERTYTATLVSHDSKTDLAIIKINTGKPMPVITVGTSSDLMPGEPVIAVGNAYGYEHTVTSGIISALHRSVQVSDSQQYRDLIQTDASINPGNSGGPLLNADGEMIGINVAVRAGAQGIGFAIPVDLAISTATNLMATNNAWHGIVAKPAAKGQLVVERIDADSPAAQSGLRPGDVITSILDTPVSCPLDLECALIGRKPGDEIELAIDRDRQSMSVSLTLAGSKGRRRADTDVAWDVIGLRLETVPARQFRELRSRYRGGLRVTAVRPGSPAFKEGIRTGDILVGLHTFETVSQAAIDQILAHPSLSSDEPVIFYILREDGTKYGTFFGHLPATIRR